MNKHISKYLEQKREAWTIATLKSTRSRLNKAAKFLNPPDPSALYREYLTKGYGLYTIKTTLIQCANYTDYLIGNGVIKGPNIFSLYLKEHANTFKHVYQKSRVHCTLEQAIVQINKIKDEQVQEVAMFLLKSGLRSHELKQISGNAVTGKGGKVRPLLTDQVPDLTKVNYTKVYRELRKVGLKPHMLRKLFATAVAEAGFSVQDLCLAMGWSSFETAYWYLQPKREQELKNKVTNIFS